MDLVKTLLLLGSNLQEKQKNLSASLLQIESRCGKLVAQSSVYETEPWGILSDNSYLNQAIIVETILNPFLLLTTLQNIELEAGRKRTLKWEDRIIDIDILLYGDFIIDYKDLRIPHPELPNRKFSLIPSCEIAPDWEHPLHHKTISELLSLCKDKCNVVKKY